MLRERSLHSSREMTYGSQSVRVVFGKYSVQARGYHSSPEVAGFVVRATWTCLVGLQLDSPAKVWVSQSVVKMWCVGP